MKRLIESIGRLQRYHFGLVCPNVKKEHPMEKGIR